MSELHPVPLHVVGLVNAYVRKERSDCEKYENREPLDHSGVWTLHDLARTIYAAGWGAGYDAQRAESEGMRP